MNRVESPHGLTCRWLGVAGIELTYQGFTILVDPYVTRIPFHKLWLGRVLSDISLVREVIQQADLVLISHAHVDHILDVPVVAEQTGAQIYGSFNAVTLLKACGTPSNQVHLIQAGDTVEVGTIKVTVLPERPHIRIPYGRGRLSRRLVPPLRAIDYRMDVNFSFLIEVAGFKLLTETPGNLEECPVVDVLFMGPFMGNRKRALDHYNCVLNALQPRLVIPIHHDDMWQPLSRAQRGQLAPTGSFFPPITRQDPLMFKHDIESLSAGTKVLLPKRLVCFEFDTIRN